jgi:hypothetical protein
MKWWSLIFVVLSAHAGPVEQAIQWLHSKEITTEASCSVTDEWCEDLFSYGCSLKKKSDNLGILHSLLQEKYLKSASTLNDISEKNSLRKQALIEGEAKVLDGNPLSQQDLKITFDEVKLTILSLIRNQKTISQKKKYELSQIIREVQLLNVEQLLKVNQAYALAQDPGNSADQIERIALAKYTAYCGDTGLELNAFFDAGHVVLCPGLIQSLKDYGTTSKQEMLNALAFTIGHELGHAIDGESKPELYQEMKTCYEKVTNNPHFWDTDTCAEVTADFWGASVLSERLRAQRISPSSAAKTIALGVDGFCDDEEVSGDGHQTGAFRVNKIVGREPSIRQTLLCAAPTVQDPFCGLSGQVPKN